MTLGIAIFDNLANSAYIQAKGLRQLGHEADLVLDPFDRHVMSDPRWEDMEIEHPTDRLADAGLPASELPPWVRHPAGALPGPPPPHTRARRIAGLIAAAPPVAGKLARAARAAGPAGAYMALQRAWVLRTLARYDCVIGYGMGPAWAALSGVPCVAMTYGGDITMVPFYDTGDWEGHERVAPPGPPWELHAQAKLQRLGYAHAGRIVLTDPRFEPYAQRLGHGAKCVPMGFFIDTDKYAPGPEPELRAELLGDRDGLIVFMPSRQDWYWKGSDRLLRGFAAAVADRHEAILVCAGWGADLARSQRLITELGIGDRVRMLPWAMSKGRLRRYYRAADIVADQFTLGSYGGSSLEAMSCARPLLIDLRPERFHGRFAELPPVINVSAPEAIAAALARLLADPSERERVGAAARRWVIANHGPPLMNRVLELCRQAVAEARPDAALPAGRASAT